jgi:dolichol kinase
MTDVVLTFAWLGTLGGGVGGAVALRRLGVASTYVRDLLHVGVGVWVLGWPAWRAPAWPVAITLVAVAATALVPALAPRVRVAARLQGAVTGGDERWGGLVLYAVAYALGTAAGLLDAAVPAGAALAALSLGDGVGGVVGRRFGRVRYRAPGGKPKSLEGSLAVAAGATVAAMVVSAWLGAPLAAGTAVAAGLVAAAVEAAAPRGTDNLLVPAAVWLFLRWIGGAP